MRRLLITFMAVCAFTMTYAQQLTVKTVNLRSQDARARTNPRDDANGKKCAIVRVGVVGVEDLVFPDAVGNVDRLLSEYIVYVPDGLKTLKYKRKTGANPDEIIFDDWGMEINSMSSYNVIFESDNHLRSAIFAIQPKNAKLLFNGEKINVDEDGMAMINKPIGEYTYQVSADGFEGQSGTVALTEDEISTLTNVALQEILYPVTINVLPDDATVFIDNVPYSKEARANLRLSGGKHSVRVTATNYLDDERTIDVNSNMSPLYFILKENKQEVVKHKEERTRTKVNIRNAFYLTGGVEAIIPDFDSKFGLVGMKGDFSFVHHFGGIFAMREGIGISIMAPSYSEDFENIKLLHDSLTHIAVDIPIQFGISFPLGKYNRHLFSIFAGGYGRGIFLIKGKDIAELYREELSDKHFELKEECYDWGARASLKLDINKFTIGMDAAKSFNGYGFSGSVTLGVKLYSLNKE